MLQNVTVFVQQSVFQY